MTYLLIAALIALLFAALLVAARGPYAVPLTVADDAGLPAIALADVRLHGQVSGPEGAPLLIALHGGPGADHRALLPLEALSGSHRVLLFDQRGAGLSERVEALAMGDYLRDLDALIARFGGGQPVTLLGHSWGAMLAVAYLGHAPGAVAKAVLIEPGFLDKEGYDAFETRRKALSRSPRMFATALLAGFRARNATGDDAAARDYLIGTMVHAFANHPRNPYHCPGLPYASPSWRFGGAASDRFWHDPSEAIAAMTKGIGHAAPLLFMAGACDTWIGPEVQAQHAARFPNAKVSVIEAAGHDVITDQPQAALAEIRAFLEEAAT